MAGEFLAGLLSGLSESYREKASEEKRIKLLKEQLAMQNAQFNQQIALRREEMAQRQGLDERRLRLEEMLGLRGADAQDRELNIREAAGKSDEQLRRDLAAMGFGHDEKMLATKQRNELVNMWLEDMYRTKAMRLQQGLNEESAEKDFDRKVRGAKVETDERIRLEKEIGKIREESDFKTSLNNFAFQIAGNDIKSVTEHGQVITEAMLQLELKANEMAALGKTPEEKNAIRSSILGGLSRISQIDREQGAKIGQIGPQLQTALSFLLDERIPPQQKAQEYINTLERNGVKWNVPTNPSDAKKRIGSSDLMPKSTATTTGQASLSNEELDGIINNNQWVKDTLDAELDLKGVDVNLLTGQFGPARTLQKGKSVLRRSKLAELLGTAEGATLEERLKNAVTRLPSYRKVYSDYSIQPPAPARPGAGRN